MNFLDKIFTTKQEELNRRKQEVSMREIKERCFLALNRRTDKARSLKQALLQGNPFCLIAEIKLASPTKGKLTNLSCREIARLYASSVADAISVLTDKTYFNGDISYLRQARAMAPQPIFRKDFIIDEYQVYETAYAGGDAFLLMAALLTAAQLKEFIILGRELDLESIIEVHTKEETEKAIKAGAEIIGINNRNLTTMNVDIGTTERLSQYIPQEKIVVSESGIVTAADARRVLSAGANGILVGTSLMQSKNSVEKILELKNAFRK